MQRTCPSYTFSRHLSAALGGIEQSWPVAERPLDFPHFKAIYALMNIATHKLITFFEMKTGKNQKFSKFYQIKGITARLVFG
jgi:hypothetical protein